MAEGHSVSEDNPIDQPIADLIFDIARATWLFALSTLFGLALIGFTWVGVVSPDYFVAAAFALIGAASALITGAKLKA